MDKGLSATAWILTWCCTGLEIADRRTAPEGIGLAARASSLAPTQQP